MFKTADTIALEQDKKCQPCWHIILSIMLGSTTIRKPRLTDGRFVALSIVVMVSVFALLILFVNGGGVRHVSIFWKEKVHNL